MNSETHKDDECCWQCKYCGAMNVEWRPFPMIAVCESCGVEEPEYCTCND